MIEQLILEEGEQMMLGKTKLLIRSQDVNKVENLSQERGETSPLTHTRERKDYVRLRQACDQKRGPWRITQLAGICVKYGRKVELHSICKCPNFFRDIFIIDTCQLYMYAAEMCYRLLISANSKMSILISKHFEGLLNLDYRNLKKITLVI